jgi:transposase
MGERRSIYDREFKLNTLKLVENSGKSIQKISDELGISPNTIHNWKKAYREGKYDGPDTAPKFKPEEVEMRRLKKELATVKMERDILKKAIGYFAKEK